MLQLTNLQGDIIATASVSESATELLSKADTFADPVNTSDPSGEDGMPTWLIEADDNEAHQLTVEATARRIAEEQRKAAEEVAARAAAARCEGDTDSKQYKKEHPQLCHEIESNPGNRQMRSVRHFGGRAGHIQLLRVAYTDRVGTLRNNG